MNKEQKEKIAINAANVWCRCFKCDGKVNATGCVCEKDKKLTCHKWYDGYRTAMLALSEYEQQMMKEAVEVPIEEAVPFGSCKWKLCAKLWLDKGVKGNKVKLIIIKED